MKSFDHYLTLFASTLSTLSVFELTEGIEECLHRLELGDAYILLDEYRRRLTQCWTTGNSRDFSSTPTPGAEPQRPPLTTDSPTGRSPTGFEHTRAALRLRLDQDAVSPAPPAGGGVPRGGEPDGAAARPQHVLAHTHNTLASHADAHRGAPPEPPGAGLSRVLRRRARLAGGAGGDGRLQAEAGRPRGDPVSTSSGGEHGAASADSAASG
jgi:hypothetical protein